MRGIHPGQVWRSNEDKTLWRVVATSNDRVALVEDRGRRRRTLHPRNFHGWTHLPRGFHPVTHAQLAIQERLHRA